MQIDIKTPYGSNVFDLQAEAVSGLIRLANALAESETEKELEISLMAEKKPQTATEAVADAWDVISKKAMEKIYEMERFGETADTASNQPAKKSRNENLFGENWRDEVAEKAPEDGQMVYEKYPDGYTGFLYIKCPECGKEKGFCAKKPTKIHICKECGKKTSLEDLKPMYVHCECGRDSKYYTNMDADSFKCKCIACGDEVDIQNNTRDTAYVTKRKCSDACGTKYGRTLGKSMRAKHGKEY